jgi:hypothetical protein
VYGDARYAAAGSFSAKVQLYTKETDIIIAGACAYASSYPPVGAYFSDATGMKIGFTGTPPIYKIWLANSSDGSVEMVESGGTFLLPCSYTVSSFTDATGAPGIIECMPMVGSIGISGLSEVVKGQAVSFGITGSLSEPAAAAVSYTWTAADFSPGSMSGTAYTGTAPAMAGACTVTLTARSTGYCTETATQAVEVLDCTAPSTDIYTLTASATEYCAGDVVTFTMENTTLGRSYRLLKNGAAVDVLTGTGGAVPFSGAFAGAGEYTARVEADGTHCAAQMTGTHVVNEYLAPTGLSLLASTLNAVCSGQTVTLTAAANDGAEYSLDGAVWQPTAEFNVTPDANSSYTLYVKSAAGCLATETDAAAVTVIPVPTNLTLTATPEAICAGESTTLTASADDGARYRIDSGEWQTSPEFGVTPGATTAYTLHVQTSAGCSATAADAATVTVNPQPANLTLTANPEIICTGQSATLTASALYGAQYSITADDTWQPSAVFNVTPASHTSYPLYVKTTAGCSASIVEAATVTVNTAPGVPTVGGGGAYCNSANITATPGPGGTGIRWTDGDGSNTASPRNVTATGTYRAVTTAPGCESGTVSVSVTISTQPGSNGQSSICGCVGGTTNCGTTCRTTEYYTTNDGECYDCQYRYVRRWDQCGGVNSYYTTVADATCWNSSCPPVEGTCGGYMSGASCADGGVGTCNVWCKELSFSSCAGYKKVDWYYIGTECRWRCCN